MDEQMNGEKKSPMMPIIIALGLVIIAGIIYAATRSNEPESAMMDDSEAMMEDNSMEGDNMAGGTMLEGSEMPDNGMVGGDAMAPHDDAMMEGDNIEGDSMMKEDDAMMEEEKSGDTMMKSAGTYEAYSPEKLAMANSGDVVLFFHAAWCPTCRALDASLNAGDIPDGLTILKVDYDSETELKKKYGVRTQHTLVQVDADGNMITSWLGGSSAADIAAKVK